MRAWCLEERIGIAGLALRNVPEPRPADDEFLIEIEGTALNRADLLQTKGLYPAPAAEHEIPGLEFAGRILAAGPRARLARDDDRPLGPGDRVLGLVAQGAWAERIAVAGELLVPLPADASPGDAGGIAECAMTVFDALRRQAGLERDRDVLVHAGSSGIGTMAQRVSREYGARFLTTASGPKCAAVRAWGADLVIDHETEDFAARVLEFTQGRGVDVILDTVGAAALDGNLRCLAPQGTLIAIGLLGGARAELDLARLLTARLTLRGSVLRSRTRAEKAALVADFRRELGAALAAGRLAPCVDRRFDFEDIPSALERMRRREHCGKILVTHRD